MAGSGAESRFGSSRMTLFETTAEPARSESPRTDRAGLPVQDSGKEWTRGQGGLRVLGGASGNQDDDPLPQSSDAASAVCLQHTVLTTSGATSGRRLVPKAAGCSRTQRYAEPSHGRGPRLGFEGVRMPGSVVSPAHPRAAAYGLLERPDAVPARLRYRVVTQTPLLPVVVLPLA
jgi:hypothetical protein